MTNAGLLKRQAELQQAREDAVFSIADDDARAAAEERAGLVVPTREPGSPDIAELEEQHRRATFAPEMFFTAEGEDGSEDWDDPVEGERWRSRMDWPTVPTIAEAEQWTRYQAGLAARREWVRRFGQPGPEP